MRSGRLAVPVLAAMSNLRRERLSLSASRLVGRQAYTSEAALTRPKGLEGKTEFLRFTRHLSQSSHRSCRSTIFLLRRYSVQLPNAWPMRCGVTSTRVLTKERRNFLFPEFTLHWTVLYFESHLMFRLFQLNCQWTSRPIAAYVMFCWEYQKQRKTSGQSN